VHVNYAVTECMSEHVVVASSDTDVFVCAVYFFKNNFQPKGLKELWMTCGTGESRRYVPIHVLVKVLDVNITDNLPAIHAITGCDTTSKVGTKHSAVQQASQAGEQISLFSKSTLTYEMLLEAEAFATRVINPKFSSCDVLRVHQYHRVKQIKFETLPPTSVSMQMHLKRAFLQAYLWYNILNNVPALDPLDFGYCIQDELLAPNLEVESIPEDFPSPCTCAKCARQTVCHCRKLTIPCSRFCKCEGGDECRNPHKKESLD
jgi:hypothetical protein